MIWIPRQTPVHPQTADQSSACYCCLYPVLLSFSFLSRCRLLAVSLFSRLTCNLSAYKVPITGKFVSLTGFCVSRRGSLAAKPRPHMCLCLAWKTLQHHTLYMTPPHTHNHVCIIMALFSVAVTFLCFRWASFGDFCGFEHQSLWRHNPSSNHYAPVNHTAMRKWISNLVWQIWRAGKRESKADAGRIKRKWRRTDEVWKGWCLVSFYHPLILSSGVVSSFIHFHHICETPFPFTVIHYYAKDCLQEVNCYSHIFINLYALLIFFHMENKLMFFLYFCLKKV